MCWWYVVGVEFWFCMMCLMIVVGILWVMLVIVILVCVDCEFGYWYVDDCVVFE